MNGQKFVRTVSLDRVTREVTEYKELFPRFMPTLKALIYQMQNNTEELKARTTRIDGVNHYLYCQAPDPIAKTPQLVVLYTQDLDTVTILSLYAQQPNGTEE